MQRYYVENDYMDIYIYTRFAVRALSTSISPIFSLFLRALFSKRYEAAAWPFGQRALQRDGAGLHSGCGVWLRRLAGVLPAGAYHGLPPVPKGGALEGHREGECWGVEGGGEDLPEDLGEQARGAISDVYDVCTTYTL